jgi:tRNA(Ile)-lysidine synthase
MDTYQQVADFIHQERLLQPGQRLVAGVSGGPDSLCLLDCLNRLGYQIIVAHLDHQLRPESAEEATFVQRVAQTYGVLAVIDRWDKGATVGPGSSIEEVARLARYRFLVQVAKENGVELIATGHTADDQVETILMHFLRGAGPSGLRGMLPSTSLNSWVGIPDSTEITLVRPLLDTTREQTQAHCIAIDLEPRLDPSNLDQTYTRNRLRHHLIPILESYNPGVRQVIRRTGRVMAGEAELVATLVADRWPELVRRGGEGVFVIRVKPFLEQPTALQRALLREVISRLRRTLRDVGFEAVERAIHFITIPQRGRRQALVGELELIHFSDEVVVREPDAPIEYPNLPQLISDRRRRLSIPGRIRLAYDWYLEATIEPLNSVRRGELMNESSPRVVAVDEISIDTPLAIRPGKPGDRIRPLGMGGSIKVSDLLINQHIPQPARARWPLVVCGEHILWVVGLRMSNDFRLNNKTKRAIVLHLRDPKDEE